MLMTTRHDALFPTMLLSLAHVCGPLMSGSDASSAGTNPYAALPVIVTSCAVVLLLLTVALLLSPRPSGEAAPLLRRWVRWLSLAGTLVLGLGCVWLWSMSTSYNDAGCVVYFRAWPIPDAAATLVASLLTLGSPVLTALLLMLGAVSLLRRKSRPASHTP